MPTRGKLTMIGLYNYDPTLFSTMQLPEGVDADITRHRILLESGQLEVMYPDPNFLKEAIEWWSKANLSRWTKLFATESLEYNPIWNVDGTESESIVRHLDEDKSEIRDRDGSTQTSDNSALQGFNSSEFDDVTQLIGNSTVTDDETVTNDNSQDETITTTKRRTGNIGVTSTQSLIREEREISDFSIYRVIAEEFKHEFCILVY